MWLTLKKKNHGKCFKNHVKVRAYVVARLSSKFHFMLDYSCFQPHSLWACPLSHSIPFIASISCPNSLISTFLGLFMVHKSRVSHLYIFIRLYFPWLRMTFALQTLFKLEIKSITMVFASIWVKLDYLNFLYCINHIIYVSLEHIF